MTKGSQGHAAGVLSPDYAQESPESLPTDADIILVWDVATEALVFSKSSVSDPLCSQG